MLGTPAGTWGLAWSHRDVPCSPGAPGKKRVSWGGEETNPRREGCLGVEKGTAPEEEKGVTRGVKKGASLREKGKQGASPRGKEGACLDHTQGGKGSKPRMGEGSISEGKEGTPWALVSLAPSAG